MCREVAYVHRTDNMASRFSRMDSPQISASSSPEISTDLNEGGMAQTSWLSTEDAVKDYSLPKGRLATIFEFREPEDESPVDDDHSSISPLSIKSEQHERQGTNGIEFCPDLSSRFSLISPVDSGSHENTRLSSLRAQLGDHRSANEPTVTKGQLNAPTSTCPDENYDTSSCYSHRSSWASMFSDYSGDRPVQYSVISPVTAGVFDDSVPVVHGFAARSLSRCDSMNKHLSESPIKMRPLSLRRCVPPPTESDPAASVDRPPSPCRTRIGTEINTDTPTLSQATEDLEDVLADFTKRMSGHPQTPNIPDCTSQVNEGGIHVPAARPVQHQRDENAPEGSEMALSSLKKLDDRKQSKVGQSDDAGRTEKSNKYQRVRFDFHSFWTGKNHRHGHDAIQSRSGSGSSPGKFDTICKSQENDCMTSRETKATKKPSKNHSLLRNDSSNGPFFADTGEIHPQFPRHQTSGSTRLKNLSDTGSFASPVQQIGGAGDQDLRTKHAKSKSEEDGIDIIFKEKIFVSSSKDQRQTEMGFSSAPEVLYELDAGLPSPSIAKKSGSRRRVCDFPTNTPESAVLSVLNNAHSLKDLFSIAIVNRRFYRVFKQHELRLMKEALLKMSPPAWEFREMSPPWDTEWQLLLDPDAQVPEYTPSLYLRCYAQDMYTLVQLKSLILARCGPFLRQNTVLGLAGTDPIHAEKIDDAFWRIWTFCRIFGCGKNREVDIIGQLDWLNGGMMAMDRHKHSLDFSSVSVSDPFGMNNVLLEPPAGFARGNEGGLSSMELYDMTEIWTCLGVLLQPLHSKLVEARQAGIYEGHDVPVGDVAKEEETLEEWTYYVLTLGLSAVLYLSSVCPVESAASTLRKAREIGLTRWEVQETGTSRSAFLKEAVSRAFGSWRKDQVRRSQSTEPPTQTQQPAIWAVGNDNASNTKSFRTLFVPHNGSNRPMTTNIHPSMQIGGPVRHQDLRCKGAAFASEIRKQEQLQYLQLQQQLQYNRQQHQQQQQQQQQQQRQQYQYQNHHPDRHQQQQPQARLRPQQRQQQYRAADINEAVYSFSSERPLSNFSNIMNFLL